MATRPTPQPGKLVVRGYGPETSDEEIRTWFEPFGPLEEGRKKIDSCRSLWQKWRSYVLFYLFHPLISSG